MQETQQDDRDINFYFTSYLLEPPTLFVGVTFQLYQLSSLCSTYARVVLDRVLNLGGLIILTGSLATADFSGVVFTRAHVQ